jgi:hypothetical protein
VKGKLTLRREDAETQETKTLCGLGLRVFALGPCRGVMIRTVRVGDIVGLRTFTSVIRYGEVVDVLARGEAGKPNRRDEISVRLKPDGQVVMVQRWRLAERYDRKKI